MGGILKGILQCICEEVTRVDMGGVIGYIKA